MVATLILIVVAIIGAIAVGLIVSNVANTTNKQVAGNNAGGDAQGTLTIGGSTTIYPVTEAAVDAFEAEYTGVTVNVAQGGSGAGMEGVIIGALDIGSASAFPVVSSYSVSAASQTPPVNLVYTNIGGSGIVVIENGPAYTTAFGTAPAGGLLEDGTEYCTGITSAAVHQIYLDGEFWIVNGACKAGTGDTNGYLTAQGVSAVGGTGFTGPYFTYSRADLPSGTQDTLGEWAGFSSTATGTSDFGGASAGDTQETGNPAVLAGVQACTNSGALGCLGFVDIGFAEQGTADTLASDISIPAVASSLGSGDVVASVATYPSEVTQVDYTGAPTGPASCSGYSSAPTTTAINCYATTVTGGAITITSSASTKILDSFIKDALAGTGPQYPDNVATTNPLNPGTNGGNDPLSRTFYYVTNGTPTPVEQDWINFIINPGSSTYFTNNGYYSVYQYKTG